MGPPFYRYRERARRRFVHEAVLEESRVVALVSHCIHVLECFSNFNICCIRVKHLNSCNYWVYSWIHSWNVYLVLFMGPSGRITHVIGYIGYILHILDCLGQDMQVL